MACESSSAIFLQHESDAVLEKVNTFFGFAAVGRMRIVQKPVSPASVDEDRIPAALGEDAIDQIRQIVKVVEDPALRQKLEALGREIYRRNRG